MFSRLIKQKETLGYSYKRTYTRLLVEFLQYTEQLVRLYKQQPIFQRKKTAFLRYRFLTQHIYMCVV